MMEFELENVKADEEGGKMKKKMRCKKCGKTFSEGLTAIGLCFDCGVNWEYFSREAIKIKEVKADEVGDED